MNVTEQDLHILIDDDKYAAEAKQIKQLLAHDQISEASERLRVDGDALAPHELHKLIAELKKGSAALPNIAITDDQHGIKVTARESSHMVSIFERSEKQLVEVSNKIPSTGELLKLTPEQTQKILDEQKRERDAGGKVHRFGDIAVSFGYATPLLVEAALTLQDQLKAAQLADDLSKGMPIQTGEGYYQMLKRTHPELTNHKAAELAHIIKTYNHNDIILRVGEQVPTLTDQQVQDLAFELFLKNRPATGNVNATYKGEPLDKIPY